MNKTRFLIPGITCGHCVMTIQSELSELSGVKEVSGDPDTKEIIVRYDDPATPEIIRNTLEQIGYPASEGK